MKDCGIWEKANVIPVFMKGKEENIENYRLVMFNLIPGRVMDQIIVEIISKHMKEKVIGSSQHGLMMENCASPT